MNTSGGHTGKLNKISGGDSDYQHPVINEPKNAMEELLSSNFTKQRHQFVDMLSDIGMFVILNLLLIPKITSNTH